MSAAEVTKRILRAALRRTPNSFEIRLALAEYHRIQADALEEEVAEMADDQEREEEARKEGLDTLRSCR